MRVVPPYNTGGTITCLGLATLLRGIQVLCLQPLDFSGGTERLLQHVCHHCSRRHCTSTNDQHHTDCAPTLSMVPTLSKETRT